MDQAVVSIELYLSAPAVTTQEAAGLGQCSGMTREEVVGGDGHWRVRDKTQRAPTDARPSGADVT